LAFSDDPSNREVLSMREVANPVRRGPGPIAPAEFPSTGLVSLHELCSHSGKRGMFPMSTRSWERGVAAGTYPSPIVLHGQRFWRVEDVRAIVSGKDWRAEQQAA
jgi:hypothetical protein